MKKIRVNSILILVVSAMLALLVVQAYQSTQLYSTKAAEFKERLSTKLERIALSHEKAEDVRRYLSVVNQDFDVNYKDLLKEEFRTMMSAEESISIEDTSVYENGVLQKYLIIKGTSYDSVSGVKAEQRVLARDVRQLRDLFNPKGNKADSVTNELKLNQRVIHQVLKKARYVNEMMIDVFRNNINEDPSKRFDIALLDSALETELGELDVPKGFEFMVTDAKNRPIKFVNAPTNYVTNIDVKKSHDALLFPSDVLDDDLYLHIRFPKEKAFVLKEIRVGLFVNILLVILILVALIFMFRTILSQNKLSEMKNDFISNMTHEFKTPISTISLACQALNDPDMIQDINDETKPFVRMINDENKRLSLLVERILQSATLDKGELKINEESIDLNTVVKEIVENAQFRISGASGEIKLELPKKDIVVQGDRMHIANLISNLVDNAVKYSGTDPKIVVKLGNDGRKTTLTVIDKGVGIKKEHLNKIFDKLYRIPTGNVHNVKGFGLGLSYVKAIADLHGWNINVKSRFGAGSEFTITIKE